MKTTGLSFTAAMVQAILSNRKTQTRRIFIPKSEPWKKFHLEAGCLATDWHIENLDRQSWWSSAYAASEPIGKLPNAPGDHLYVKETFRTIYDPSTCLPDALDIDYKADGNERIGDKIGRLKWKSGRFMPKWAARIWLEVTACRFEWLQDITFRDCEKEGLIHVHRGWWVCPTAEDPQASGDTEGSLCFKKLWDSINAKRAPWSSNPLVVVREFRKIERPKRL